MKWKCPFFQAMFSKILCFEGENSLSFKQGGNSYLRLRIIEKGTIQEVINSCCPISWVLKDEKRHLEVENPTI